MNSSLVNSINNKVPPLSTLKKSAKNLQNNHLQPLKAKKVESKRILIDSSPLSEAESTEAMKIMIQKRLNKMSSSQEFEAKLDFPRPKQRKSKALLRIERSPQVQKKCNRNDTMSETIDIVNCSLDSASSLNFNSVTNVVRSSIVDNGGSLRAIQNDLESSSDIQKPKRGGEGEIKKKIAFLESPTTKKYNLNERHAGNSKGLNNR
jgi:hypothetical protein